jgi:hypothetical protein
MSVNVKVPDELYQRAAELAKEKHISVDEVFASAFSEQLAAWNRLQQRASRGDRKTFFDVLNKTPDAEPDEQDPL